jgi:hypothetical protein
MRRMMPRALVRSSRLGEIYGPISRDQEADEYERIAASNQKALAVGTGGIGIGFMIVLALAAVFLLSRRR